MSDEGGRYLRCPDGDTMAGVPVTNRERKGITERKKRYFCNRYV